MALTNAKIRLHGEYALWRLFPQMPYNRCTTTGVSIFNLSGNRRMINVNESAHVFAFVPSAMALSFDSDRATALSSKDYSLNLAAWLYVCVLQHTRHFLYVCKLLWVYALSICACACSSEVLVRTHGRGQRERSLIKTDRSNTLAFLGWWCCWELRVPQPRSLSDQSPN